MHKKYINEWVYLYIKMKNIKINFWLKLLQTDYNIYCSM